MVLVKKGVRFAMLACEGAQLAKLIGYAFELSP